MIDNDDSFKPTFSRNVLLSDSLSEIVSQLPPVDYTGKLKGEAISMERLAKSLGKLVRLSNVHLVRAGSTVGNMVLFLPLNTSEVIKKRKARAYI